MNKNTDEVVFEIRESMLSGTFDVLLDGKVLAEMMDEDIARLLLDIAKGFHEKNAQLAAARELLKQASDCKLPCLNCDETGVEYDTDGDACRACGGYGFNVGGDIREVVLDIEKLLAKGGSQ